VGSRLSMEKFDPGFVIDFMDRDFAILTINLIVEMQRSDWSYTKIVNYPGLAALFEPSWRNRNLRIKLKNMVRDLREFKKPLNDEWVDAQKFFLERKRIK
jgi:hypothetical protein